MSTHQLDQLIASGAIPNLHVLPKKNWVTISEFKKWSEAKKISRRRSVIIVVDGATWAASDIAFTGNDVPKGSVIHSGNGKIVGKYIRQKTFSEYKLVDDPDPSKPKGLAVTRSVTAYSNNHFEEEERMSNLDGLNLGALQEELETKEQEQGAAAAGAGAGLTPMTEYGTGGAPAGTPATTPNPEAAQAAKLSQAVADALGSHEVGSPTKLHMYNRVHGKLTGYIVAEDARIEFNLRPVAVVVDGKKQLEAGTPEHIHTEYTSTGKVASEYVKKRYKIGARQTTPGRVEAVVVKIPVSGMVENTRFRKSEEIVPDNDGKDTTLKTLILPRLTYVSFLGQYFGAGIKEDPATHKELAGEAIVVNVQRVITEGGKPKTRVHRKLVNRARKSLITPHNYLPLKTYETVSLNSNFDEATEADLNRSAFLTLANSNAPKKSQTKLSLVEDEDQGKIEKIDATTVKSRFITRNSSERIDLKIKPFWGDKGSEPLQEIRLPLKEEVDRKGKAAEGGPTYRYIKYNALDSKTLQNPLLEKKTSLRSGEFDIFIEAVGRDLLTVDRLRELTRRKTSGSQTTLSNEMMIKMEIGLAQKWINPELVTTGTNREEQAAISDQIYSLLMETKQAETVNA